MGPNKIAFLIVACLASSTALAQGGAGGGGGSGGGAAGASSSSGARSGTTGAVGTSGGATANTGVQSPTATQPSDDPFKDPLGQGVRPAASNPNPNSTQTQTSAPPGSPTAAQAKRNSGAAHSADGLPIGTTGSGPGSPEQPIGK